MSHLGCPEVLPHLESYHQGDASTELAVLLEDHLGRCPECRRRLAHLKQVSAMLSAWRPRRVPADLKIEVAETVSDELGAAAREAFARGLRPARKRFRESPLTPAQRVANALALVALLVLGLAILYKVWSTNATDRPAAPAPHEMRFAVRLVAIGPAEETGDDLAARRRRVAEAIRETTGITEEAAHMAMDRLPTTLCRRATQAEADAVCEALRSVGARMEAIDTAGGPAETP